MKYDFFIAGRWRNRNAIAEVMETLRKSGKEVYCFIENGYKGDGIDLDTSEDADIEKMMSETEQLKDWRTNPTFRRIFETDMQAERDAKAFIAVFPMGFSAHMELGAAYGMGKKCYGIGEPEKAETLYLMFDGIYSSVGEFIEADAGVLA